MDTLARDPDHYRKVVDILVFNDPTYRDKVLKNPRSYKVHTSHFADSDKRDIKRKGASEMDSLVVPHMRSRIKLLEEQLADNKNLYSTAKIEAERLREKLGQAAREKEVLMEQLEHVQAQLGAAQHTRGNVIANLAKELERKNAEIDGMLDGLVDRPKGFDQCEALVVARGARIVAPARRWQGQRHYTADERQGNGEKSNLRINVERHFSRVHNWRVFSEQEAAEADF
eukprot:jgi/Tetstr1/430723/TSEL_020514.t1